MSQDKFEYWKMRMVKSTESTLRQVQFDLNEVIKIARHAGIDTEVINQHAGQAMFALIQVIGASQSALTVEEALQKRRKDEEAAKAAKEVKADSTAPATENV